MPSSARRSVSAGLGVLLVLLGLAASPAVRPAVAAASVPSTMVAGQSVTSDDGRFRLDLQGDGNLVVYRTSGGVVWHAGTYGNPGARLSVQADGNVVLYAESGRPLWHTGTYSGEQNRMELRDDGRLLVLSPSGHQRWSSGPAALGPGDEIAALNRSHRLLLQPDGNLVVYAADGRAAWHASTHGTGVNRVTLQDDGNLVAYEAHGTPVWHTGTHGNPGARLVMQTDGNLVVYAADGRALWAAWWSGGVPFHPPYAWADGTVDAGQLGASWSTGCPVGPTGLRRVWLRYIGFDGRWRTGELVVNADAVGSAARAFGRMYDARFPLHSVRPVSEFGASDAASMDANNTSAFNCRRVSGSSAWSEHAYGRALDVNPVQNPYVAGSTVQPYAGRAYLDRGHVRPGMVVSGGPVTTAFAAEGWGWGGSWTSSKDYQHFSATGR